jgi:hypothetical protein
MGFSFLFVWSRKCHFHVTSQQHHDSASLNGLIS